MKYYVIWTMIEPLKSKVPGCTYNSEDEAQSAIHKLNAIYKKNHFPMEAFYTEHMRSPDYE